MGLYETDGLVHKGHSRAAGRSLICIAECSATFGGGRVTAGPAKQISAFDPRRILVELEALIGDVQTQTGDPARLAGPADEIAIRFHHRLVSIHPFPNGNGRHARLAADLLAIALGQNRFTWGGGSDLPTAAASIRAQLTTGLNRG